MVSFSTSVSPTCTEEERRVGDLSTAMRGEKLEEGTTRRWLATKSQATADRMVFML